MGPFDMLQVVSANRLTDGIVVFLGESGAWVESLQRASVHADRATLDAALARAAADVQANVVIEVAAFNVVRSGEKLRAAHIRDAIRAAGPTVHLDHGKQAAGL
jgi:hypothetical protein